MNKFGACVCKHGRPIRTVCMECDTEFMAELESVMHERDRYRAALERIIGAVNPRATQLQGIAIAALSPGPERK